MCGHSLEKVKILVRKLAKHVINALYALRKALINLLPGFLWMKRVMGYLQTSVISPAVIIQNCDGGSSLFSLHFFLYLRRLRFFGSLLLIQNSFKSQRIHKPSQEVMRLLI